jgi:hypothetical protein
MVSHEEANEVSVLMDRLQIEWGEVVRARNQGDSEGEGAALLKWRETLEKINALMPAV